MKRNDNIIYTVKFVLCACLIASAILLLGFAFKGALDKRNSDTSPTFSTNDNKIMLIIDAGHGGEDAGAIAEDGTLEKDLNLQIASLVKVLCDLNGTEATMTRDDDRLLYDHYDDLEDYTGQKKLYDLKNRVKIAREYEKAVYLSIHMNKFSQEKYSGTQVYYSKNDKASEILARQIQNSTRLYLQPTNNRKIKSAGTDIYVLNSLECPAVLVECGFLSNANELSLLKDSSYQSKMALVLFSAALSQVE